MINYDGHVDVNCMFQNLNFLNQPLSPQNKKPPQRKKPPKKNLLKKQKQYGSFQFNLRPNVQCNPIQSNLVAESP